MDFGKNILQKYGWKEGEGIGKNADGIAKPIKANLKFDNAGLGHDRAKEFTNHWWQNAYNEAAKNIDVSTGDDAVSVSLKNGESIEITTKDYSVKELKKNRSQKAANGYGSFIKGSVLLNKDGCDKAKDSDDDDDEKMLPSTSAAPAVLSDEALFAACGGRTAHKGARHGLSLGGKLSRIEEQEKQLLASYAHGFNANTATDVFKEWTQVDTKKKQKQKSKQLPIPPTPDIEGIAGMDPLKLSGLISQDDYAARRKTKKSRKRQRVMIEDLSSSLAASMTTTTPSILADDEPEFDRSEWRGVQNSSKTIKKDKKKKYSEKEKKKKGRDTVDGIAEATQAHHFLKESILGAVEPVAGPSTQRPAEPVTLKIAPKDKKKSKKRKRIEVEPELSDDDDLDLKHGNLANHIKKQMEKNPNKKYKVIVENMTAFQSKHLAKAGIAFVERKPKGVRHSEVKAFESMSRKMRTSLSLEDDEEP